MHLRWLHNCNTQIDIFSPLSYLNTDWLIYLFAYLPIVNNLTHNANKIDLTIQQVELFHTGISKISLLCQYHCWRTIHYNLNVSGHQLHEKTPPSCVGHRGQTPNWEPNLHRWVFLFRSANVLHRGSAQLVQNVEFTGSSLKSSALLCWHLANNSKVTLFHVGLSRFTKPRLSIPSKTW